MFDIINIGARINTSHPKNAVHVQRQGARRRRRNVKHMNEHDINGNI